MSYLSPQAEEIVSDNNRQPNDLSHDDWSSPLGLNGPGQVLQGMPWLRRHPPRLRPGAKG